MNEQEKSVIISSIVMIVILGGGLFPVLVFLSNRVTKFVWHEEKIIPVMLFTLTTTTFFLIIYYLWIIVVYAWPEWGCAMLPPDGGYPQTYACTTATIPNLPSFFLAIAVLLNVNKWIYFELRIFAFIGVGKLASEQMVEKEQRLLRYSQQL
jgi:subtilase family serine protease